MDLQWLASCGLNSSSKHKADAFDEMALRSFVFLGIPLLIDSLVNGLVVNYKLELIEYEFNN